ncbi:MAG TPA: bacteriocin, partial [Acidimicrobiaceae bacterium]|nr:bacteriocin [Acidimicrobiaceae bacterium]
DPRAMARFWDEAMDWTLHEVTGDHAVLRSAKGVGPYLQFLRTPETKTVKNRVHLDLRPYPGDDQAAEVARLRALGATDIDLEELDEAVRQIALGENVTVFHGFGAAGMDGITEATSHPPIPIETDMEKYPNVVARATDVLRRAGIEGPYGLAIGPELYTGIGETTEHGGYLLFDHLRQLLGGPLVWAPGVRGGIVLSLRGGDFVLECGQDLSIGYQSHDAEVVRLYLEESVSFRVIEPDAAVALVPKA